MTDTKPTLVQRITNYLSNGGLWNPEAMEHDKVRTLLIDCRDKLQSIKTENKCIAAKYPHDDYRRAHLSEPAGEQEAVASKSGFFNLPVLIAQSVAGLRAECDGGWSADAQSHLRKLEMAVRDMRHPPDTRRQVPEKDDYDALKLELQAAQQERDDALKAVDDNWVTHQQVVATRERAVKAEADNKRLVELQTRLREYVVAYIKQCNTIGGIPDAEALLREVGK